MYQTLQSPYINSLVYECCWSNWGALRATGVTGRKLTCVFHLAITGVNNILLSR